MPTSADSPVLTSADRNGSTFDLYQIDANCNGAYDDGDDIFRYFERVDVQDLLPGLREEVRRLVPEPVVEFLPLDPEFGWTYVKVGTDFRISSSLEPVSADASLTSGPVSVWASVTATPRSVTFEPGEPGGYRVECAPDAAQAGYDPDRLGACAYTYQNSSAVSPNGRTFSTSVTVEWDITFDSSTGSGTYPAITMTSAQDLAVAEIQALVTCTGPRPEQGGC